MAENEKEKQEKRKRQREVALLNLNGNVSSLASAYFIENSNQFGDAVGSAVDQFIYQPALSGMKFTDIESLKEGDILSSGLFSTRQDGRRYSGSIDEHYILKSAATIMQDSLMHITAEDVFKLMGDGSSFSEKLKRKIAGFGKQAKDGYKELYLSELPEEMQHAIIETYQSYLAYTGASTALGIAAKKMPGNLEKILTEEPPQKLQKKAA
jgi:hypothetical protein